MEYPGLTGIIKFDNRGLRGHFALDIVELMEGGQTVVGLWNSSMMNPLNISRIFMDEDEDNLANINRTFIIMTTLVREKFFNLQIIWFSKINFQTQPYGFMKESQAPLYGNDQYEGFAIDLIKELAVMKGFNYTFRIREDKANGERLPNGSWTGMIGDIRDGVSGSYSLTLRHITLARPL